MAKKKKSGANESKWITEPEAAPEGSPFCDVAYEHRLHTEPLEVLGVTFVPGQITTYRTRADVPDAMLEHPELMARDTAFGVCRIDPMFRYTPLTLVAYEALRSEAAAYERLRLDATNPRNSAVIEGIEVEPEGGE